MAFAEREKVPLNDRLAVENSSEAGRPTKKAAMQLLDNCLGTQNGNFLTYVCWFLFQKCKGRTKGQKMIFLYHFHFVLLQPGNLFRIKVWIWTPIGVDPFPESAYSVDPVMGSFLKVWVLIQLREVSFEQMVFKISMWWIDFYTAGVSNMFWTGASGSPDLLISYSEGPPFWCPKKTPAGCYLGITRMTRDLFFMF